MEISKIEPLTLNKIYKILSAMHITPSQKEDFVNKNSVEINKLLAGKANCVAFQKIMENRPLKIFKPLKNSYTKIGDRKILAEVLGIKPSEVKDFMHNITERIKNGETDNLTKEQLELAKMYAYRHGNKEELLEFFDYELSSAKNILETLYHTLQYNTGGAADYFVRPIHRMNNKTLAEVYDIVDRNLKNAVTAGNISKEDKERTAEWSLVRIYEIQNNQKIKNAAKIKKELSM